MNIRDYSIIGFADAKPSEAIQHHTDPGIVVVALFATTSEGRIPKPPVAQYKDVSQRHKLTRAEKLDEWLKAEYGEGTRISGFYIAATQVDIVTMGLSMIEELSDCSIERHYEGYRLKYDSSVIDLSQAVALAYYSCNLQFAGLRVGLQLPPSRRRILILMDRFPGVQAGDTNPGRPLPVTDGYWFLQFLKAKSPTMLGIRNDNAKLDLTVDFDTLDWWRADKDTEWIRGKTHAGFVLADWLAVSAMAGEFPKQFAQTFRDKDLGGRVVASLQKLNSTFKMFDLWNLDSSIGFFRGEVKQWEVPNEAREYIMSRARSTKPNTS